MYVEIKPAAQNVYEYFRSSLFFNIRHEFISANLVTLIMTFNLFL